MEIQTSSLDYYKDEKTFFGNISQIISNDSDDLPKQINVINTRTNISKLFFESDFNYFDGGEIISATYQCDSLFLKFI